MTLAEELGAFAARAGPEEPGPPAREALAVHLLDTLGCAIAAAGEAGPSRLLAHLAAGGGPGRSTAIGAGRLPPDRAALGNAAHAAWLDRHDAFPAYDDVLHPAEAIAAVLAAAEEADADGGALLAGIAVAYALAVRTSTEAPVRARGFDRSTHLAVAAAGGAARALGLEGRAAAHAIAIAAARAPTLGVARDGAPSDLALLAGPLAVRDGLDAALLARSGFTGPADVFEGRRGVFEALTGPFLAGNAGGLDAVTRVAIRLHPGHVQAQAAIEAALELAGRPDFAAPEVTRVEVLVPPRWALRPAPPLTPDLREPVAAALAGGTPGARERLRALVEVRGDAALAHRFPAEAPVVVRVHRGRAVLEAARRDAEGAPTRPATFDRALAKFERLAARAPPALRRELVTAVRALPGGSARALAGLLAAVR